MSQVTPYVSSSPGLRYKICPQKGGVVRPPPPPPTYAPDLGRYTDNAGLEKNVRQFTRRVAVFTAHSKCKCWSQIALAPMGAKQTFRCNLLIHLGNSTQILTRKICLIPGTILCWPVYSRVGIYCFCRLQMAMTLARRAWRPVLRGLFSICNTSFDSICRYNPGDIYLDYRFRHFREAVAF